jgi:hypothetical protein
VIYEVEQVEPLIDSVYTLLKQTADAEFILAFARRNVPMDKVLAAAERRGLVAETLDKGIDSMEPIYSIRWRDQVASTDVEGVRAESAASSR